MPEPGEIVIDIRGVQKDYHALRPVRVKSLQVRSGESVALLGFDQAAAEVLVNLITAATLPDTGDLDIFGRRTSTIQDPATWLEWLDHFGILGDRAVVLDALTVEDNLIMPVTMALHAVDSATREQARRLAMEVGLDPALLASPVGSLDAPALVRLRLARALAPGPRVLLGEHPNATITGAALDTFARDYGRIVRDRGITSIVFTADMQFAAALAPRVLTLQPATGELKPPTAWSRWFS